ncbi:hypothetical protein SYNTR_1882 [Candidatus Syntrophocurvum alkaliphilum]|uniref:Uncharacterized protein n=2 Tax=Candidatus Syntrophocurvum alkaliphilum TaxID=2293317 RepID=A0A6I6DEE6_9FIRM|nr:hypothetical protein SYNTR_1882 [Candidatus Syntrophocurvum alkaliphilum]
MRFQWSPSATDVFQLITPEIDGNTTSSLQLNFKHFVNDYEGGYTLKVQISTDDGNTWDDEWTITPNNNITAEIITICLNEYDGQEFNIAWVFDGNSMNINQWYIDDIIVTGN